MPDLIFPEKLMFDKNTSQIRKPSEGFDLLCNGGKGLGWVKKKRAAKMLLSPGSDRVRIQT
jgi:hypothetical protein